MNILVFSWRDPKHPKAGGAEQVMHEHLKGWAKAGHKVTLFSSNVNGLVKSESLDGVEIIRQGHQYLGVQIAGFFYYLKNRNKFDFLVDQFHGIPFFTPIYSKKPKIAVIQEIARNVWFLNPLRWPLNWLIGAAGFICEPIVFLFYKSSYFMTGSESAKRDVSKMGIPFKQITIVPHGVLVKTLEVGNKKLDKEKNKTIVFLGLLSKDKGIEDAIRCFAILRDRNTDWNFWVIGKPETEDFGKYIKRLSEKVNLKVKFWGFVSKEKKFELLSRAHVLVNPSVHEGWGLVNIEANTVGTPVVAYPNAGLVDSVKNNVSGILCQKKTPESLAENIEKLLSSKKVYTEYRVGAKKWSENFKWEKSIKKSLKLISYVYNR